MKLLGASALVGLSLVLAPPVLAQDANVLAGVGSASCGKFTASLKESAAKTEALYLSWAQGFLSSINLNRKMQNDNAIDFSTTPPAAQLAWIKSYCQKNPMRTYLRATTELFLALQQAQASAAKQAPAPQ